MGNEPSKENKNEFRLARWRREIYSPLNYSSLIFFEKELKEIEEMEIFKYYLKDFSFLVRSENLDEYLAIKMLNIFARLHQTKISTSLNDGEYMDTFLHETYRRLSEEMVKKMIKYKFFSLRTTLTSYKDISVFSYAIEHVRNKSLVDLFLDLCGEEDICEVFLDGINFLLPSIVGYFPYLARKLDKIPIILVGDNFGNPLPYILLDDLVNKLNYYSFSEEDYSSFQIFKSSIDPRSILPNIDNIDIKIIENMIPDAPWAKEAKRLLFKIKTPFWITSILKKENLELGVSPYEEFLNFFERIEINKLDTNEKVFLKDWARIMIKLEDNPDKKQIEEEILSEDDDDIYFDIDDKFFVKTPLSDFFSTFAWLKKIPDTADVMGNLRAGEYRDYFRAGEDNIFDSIKFYEPDSNPPQITPRNKKWWECYIDAVDILLSKPDYKNILFLPIRSIANRPQLDRRGNGLTTVRIFQTYPLEIALEVGCRKLTEKIIANSEELAPLTLRQWPLLYQKSKLESLVEKGRTSVVLGKLLHRKYMPGGGGYFQAKEHFETLQRKQALPQVETDEEDEN